MLQTSVVIVSPGGTGRPALVISARPEPMPPSRSFIVRSPSGACLPPKRYDVGLRLAAVLAAAGFLAGLAFLAALADFVLAAPGFTLGRADRFEAAALFDVAARFFDIYDSGNRIVNL